MLYLQNEYIRYCLQQIGPTSEESAPYFAGAKSPLPETYDGYDSGPAGMVIGDAGNGTR